jgi:hypothetical protein
VPISTSATTNFTDSYYNSAKRYERLMKAHGIGSSGTSSAASSPKKATVKKEKEGAASRQTPKKRKLEMVDEDAGDEDEPIKGEVKSEIKCEDAANVKTEHGNDGVGATAPSAFALSTQPDALTQASQADESEVLMISSNEKPSNSIPTYGGDYGHHRHLHMSAQHIPAQHVPGVRSFDYAANMGYSLQATPTSSIMMLTRPSSGTPLPYGFGPSPFVHNHDTSGFFLQGSHVIHPQPSHHHKEDPTNRES